MSQQTQSEIDKAEAAALEGTELVDIGGFSSHNGFIESSDDSMCTDWYLPTNMFQMSD